MSMKLINYLNEKRCQKLAYKIIKDDSNGKPHELILFYKKKHPELFQKSNDEISEFWKKNYSHLFDNKYTGFINFTCFVLALCKRDD